jgi:hypothetical protein
MIADRAFFCWRRSTALAGEALFDCLETRLLLAGIIDTAVFCADFFSEWIDVRPATSGLSSPKTWPPCGLHVPPSLSCSLIFHQNGALFQFQLRTTRPCPCKPSTAAPQSPKAPHCSSRFLLETSTEVRHHGESRNPRPETWPRATHKSPYDGVLPLTTQMTRLRCPAGCCSRSLLPALPLDSSSPQ